MSFCSCTGPRSLVLTVSLLFGGTPFIGPCIGQESNGGEPQLDSGLIRQTATDVLSDPKFRRLKRRSNRDDDGFLSRFLDPLKDRGSPAGESNSERSFDATSSLIAKGIGQFLMVVALMAVAMLIGLIAVIAIRSIERHRKRSTGRAALFSDQSPHDSTIPPGDLESGKYALRAREYARQRDFRSALRQLLLGSMSWTECHELIRFRRGLTNRDYYRALHAQNKKQSAFVEIAMEFEKVYFGRRAATEESFQSCLGVFEQEFNGQTV